MARAPPDHPVDDWMADDGAEGTLRLMQDVTGRIRRIRDALTAGLVERDLAIRLALLAALAGEHLLLIGPPGTAKSLLARRLHLAFADSTYFERLLTRFSVPEELFGPLSIKGLEEDRYERLTDSYLPKASIAFLDEIFKANSAILNALLTLLNEREFDNGAERVATPLMAVVGASNELPESGELDALFDRFLLRLQLAPVSKHEFPKLLQLPAEPPAIPNDIKLTSVNLKEIQSDAAGVHMPDDVLALLCDLREWCHSEDIFVSDRRWRKVVKLLKTSALTNGRNAVSIWDCWLLQHCLWGDAGEREKIYNWYVARVGVVCAEPVRLIGLVNGYEQKLNKDKSGQSRKRDSKGRFLFDRGDGRPTTRKSGQAYSDGERLYTLREGVTIGYSNRVDATNSGQGYTKSEIQGMNDLRVRGHYVSGSSSVLSDYLKAEENWHIVEHEALMEPTRHKHVYIKHIKDELNAVRRRLAEHKDGIDKRAASLQDDVQSHLWVDDGFAQPASQGLENAREDVEALLARLSKVAKGFDALPQEEEEPLP